MVDDRQSDANENDDPDGFEVFCKAIASVAHTPLGLIVEATARRFPSHSLTRIIVDVRKRSAALLEPGLLYTLLNLIISCASLSASSNTRALADPMLPETHIPGIWKSSI